MRNAGGLRSIGEATPPVVGVVHEMISGEVGRRAVGTTQPGEAKIDLAIDLGRPLHIVPDKKVEVAIAVGVEEAGGGAPGSLAAAGARRLGDVDQSVSIVAVQAVAPDRGNVDVGITVCIDVTARDAHPVEVVVESPLGRGVAECSLTIVEVQGHGGEGAWLTVPVRAVDQKEIGITVPVDVGERAPAAHRFG